MRCSELLPEVSQVFDYTEAILGEISPTHASLSEVSLEMRPPRGFSPGFGAMEVSLWRCSELLPEISPVFDHTVAILGEISPTYASLPEVYLEMRPPREFSLGFGTIKASFWRCTKLLPEISPVFDRTEAILGEISPTYASLPDVSLEMRPPVSSLSGSLPSRSLFGAVANYYRRPLQYSIVQKLFLERYLPHTLAFQRSLWKCAPPREFSIGFVAIEVSLWRCSELLPEVPPVFDHTEAVLGAISPHMPAFQRSLWKCVPPVVSAPGSVPSRHLFGAVANYYRRSLQYSIVQKLFLGRYLPHKPAFQRSL